MAFVERRFSTVVITTGSAVFTTVLTTWVTQTPSVSLDGGSHGRYWVSITGSTSGSVWPTGAVFRAP